MERGGKKEEKIGNRRKKKEKYKRVKTKTHVVTHAQNKSSRIIQSLGWEHLRIVKNFKYSWDCPFGF